MKPIISTSRCLLSVSIASALLLTGCGGDDDNTSVIRDNFTSNEAIATFNQTNINSLGLSAIGVPAAKCGVAVEKIDYHTRGAANERTNATAAVMLPTGSSAACTGNRPILLYAHGTTTDKNYDITQVGNQSNSAAAEAALIAASFAAQGYIVVAPNYAGYDDSKLSYHPYLVAEQQSKDMVDALDNARVVIARQKLINDINYRNISAGNKLFVSGYSQGGYVAMATARRLESNKETVTALAPSSGPYALAAFADAIFAGNVNIGATRFAPLLAYGMQPKYNNIYNQKSDIFLDKYASTPMPNVQTFSQLVAADKLPENALFEATPTGNTLIDNLPKSTLPFAPIGFDKTNYLVKTDYRAAYMADALQNRDGLLAGTGVSPAADPKHPLRIALKDNDLRGYLPSMPTMLCGGNQDPTVFYDLNTGSMAQILANASISNPALNVTVLDVDTTNADKRTIPSVSLIGKASTNPWSLNAVVTQAQTQFSTSYQFTVNNAIQNGVSPQAAILANYHGALVSSACMNATRQFFDQNFVNTPM
ncbi:alpha/beta hydrolase family protein [Psychrobacter aestuarii]|uniref:Dienelactone hydrolase domain-containing protein n=1 Tax=Psychrobacter aestuarii TaxID=556327 RepID=A0ABP3FPB9_9GAMM|nr:dienelactone hydrolase family protein [Psychrobacter aestuarii]